MASLKKHEKYIQNYYNKITKFLYIKTFTIFTEYRITELLLEIYYTSKLLQNYPLENQNFKLWLQSDDL